MSREKLNLKDVLIVLLLGAINIFIFSKSGNIFFENLSHKNYTGFGFYIASILLASLYLNPWLIFTSSLVHIAILLIFSWSGFLGLFLFLAIVLVQLISIRKLHRKADVAYGVTYFIKREFDSKQKKASKYDICVTMLLFIGFIILTVLDDSAWVE